MDFISEKIKEIRSEFKLTQEDFAFKIGISRSNLAQIETGKTNPTLETISKICLEFNLNSNYFFDVNLNIKDFVNSNVNLNVSNGVNLNAKTSGKTENFKEKNSNYLKEKVLLTDRVIEGLISETYSLDQLSSKTKKLRELAASYNNRVNRDLQNNHENLYEVLQLAANVDALADLIWTSISAYINARPNPFEPMQYLDLENRTENIPDTIDYKTYKQDVLTWLENIEKYKDIITTFYDQGESFLQQLKPLDKDGIIE